ncbi:sufE chloroplastic mitochondrial [Micractinium conductrix]|uniref:SufE chloroplastic mitochondrial n=1 Tax=Micractinium conductrix TaxID=554055 RepID=A0A2P6V121_9CHLO|nr:sufE chloroplastic mitochondrial [Micractinium conductrix]|eukprot:PSC67797.1 sufE chloroplastic mitochondrial [Micractinium conductrix]
MAVGRSARLTVCASATASAELPQSLQTLVQAFQSVPDPMARYKQLLFCATKLEPFPVEAHTEENKVKGCVSQVWVIAELRDGKVWWKADSDSALTKGLAALLVQGLSGCTPEQIVRVPPDFISMLGLQQSLTPSRNNGFLNMFKLMQKKALDVYMQQQAGSDDESPSSSDAGNGGAAGATQAAAPPAAAAGSGSDGNGSESKSNTPVADSMRAKLRAELAPLKLDIIDNSHQHAGHGGYRGSASYSGETHFTVEVVSPRFEGLTSIKRHRLVYGILKEELRSPVHALSLITKSPAEAGM